MAARQTAAQAALEGRATEAAGLIDRLILAGETPATIATATKASERSVYRWWREGSAPHPVMLEAIQRLADRRLAR
jgi:DNA invertase Pin-like site-specific DNA recombinase